MVNFLFLYSYSHRFFGLPWMGSGIGVWQTYPSNSGTDSGERPAFSTTLEKVSSWSFPRLPSLCHFTVGKRCRDVGSCCGDLLWAKIWKLRGQKVGKLSSGIGSKECEPRRLTITITTQVCSNCAIITSYFFPGQLEDGSVITSTKKDQPHHTVDERNPAVPGTYKTLVNNWKRLPTSTGDRRISEPSTVSTPLKTILIPLKNWWLEDWSGFTMVPIYRGHIHPIQTSWYPSVLCRVNPTDSFGVSLCSFNGSLDLGWGRFNDDPTGAGLDPMVYL